MIQLKDVENVVAEVFAAEGVIYTETMLNRPIMELGADSLAFAIIVARLEELTGTDPFSTNPDLPYPKTLKEFADAYITS